MTQAQAASRTGADESPQGLKIRDGESAALVRGMILRASGVSCAIWLVPFWLGTLANSPPIFFAAVGFAASGIALHATLCHLYVRSLSDELLLDVADRVPSMALHPFALWETRRRSLSE